MPLLASFAERPLCRAVRAALFSSVLLVGLGASFTVQAAGSVALDASQSKRFDISAGPLGRSLSHFALTAGIALSFDPALTEGKTTPGVSGALTAREAAARLLADSGLEIIKRPDGSFTLRPAADAAAQDAPDAGATMAATAAGGTLPTVMVTEAGLDATTEHSGSYTTGGVAIGKITRPLRETPQSVTVVTRYRLDDQNMRTVDDALLNAPGVIAEYQSSTERKFYSRGFEIDQVQFDGVPTERGNGFSTSYDLAAYDRVEILRGPGGLFNGAGDPGGTINLVRKRPTREAQSLASARIGSWNFKRAEADLSRPLNSSGSVRGRIVAAYEDREYFYDYADADKQVLYGVVEADLGPRTTLGAGINYERTKSIPFYTGLPRFSNGADLRLPRSAYTNGGWSRSDIENKTVFVDLKHQFDENWRMKLSVSSLREDNVEATGAAYGAVNPTTGKGFTMSAFDQELRGKQTVFDGYLVGNFEALGRRHDFVLGGNYQKRDYDLYSQGYDGYPIDPYTYDARHHPFMPQTPARAAGRTNNHREQYGLYSYLRWSLTDAARLTFGGRYSTFKHQVFNKGTNAFTTRPYEDKGVFTPYGALEYDVAPNWTGYLSYARIFKSQANLYTASGEPLDPATGNNIELGLKGELLQGRLNASFALFRTVQENRSQQDPDNPSPCAASPTGGACYVAEGKVRSEGLDMELSGALTPGWQIMAGYTYNTTRYLHDRTATGLPSTNEGLPLSTFTPRHLLRLWTAYRLPGAASKWTVAGGVNLQSATYKRNSVVTVEQGGYAVWSARIAYQINPNVSAALNVTNLFDKHYYRTIGLANGNWYGEPRNVMVTLQAAF